MSVYFDTDANSLDKGAQNRQGTIDAVEAMVSFLLIAMPGILTGNSSLDLQSTSTS